MKYIYTFVVIAITSFIIITINPKAGHSNLGGADPASVGSPHDPAQLSCAQLACHSAGQSTFKADMITSDIPATGYVAGTEYNITAEVKEVGKTSFGYQVSPQFLDGATAGTLNGDGLEAQVKQNRYVTHTNASNTGTDMRSWTFKWTAPATGSGPVTFYAAFLVGNNNTLADQNDITYTSTMSIAENGHLAVQDFAQAGMAIYPIPFKDKVTINKGHQKFETATVKIFSIDGKQVLESLVNGDITEINTTHLSQGTYFVYLEADGVTAMQKVIK